MLTSGIKTGTLGMVSINKFKQTREITERKPDRLRPSRNTNGIQPLWNLSRAALIKILGNELFILRSVSPPKL